MSNVSKPSACTLDDRYQAMFPKSLFELTPKKYLCVTNNEYELILINDMAGEDATDAVREIQLVSQFKELLDIDVTFEGEYK